jgi:nicotinate-nucleotide--dimethylbenzimidazole phosphoribosyltransferase
MKTFKIIRPDENIRPALIDKINNLTKLLKIWPCK